MKQVDERIPTNLRNLLILEVFGKTDRPLTPTEINEELGLPKQTVHRLCRTLEEEGFLVREVNGKRLQPSPRLRAMASGILYNTRNLTTVRQILLEVASAINETVNFVVPEDAGMIYVDRVETDWPFRIQLPAGSHVPFHCTASGKTFMASLAPGLRRSFVDNINLERLTPNTFVDVNALLGELAHVAQQGYAVDNEEFMEGMVAVAVPVRDGRGRYCASLAFHAPTQRLALKDALARRESLVDAARRLGEVWFA